MKLFIREMNLQVKALFLKNTKFTNPHGLSDKANHSTAYELCKIASHAIRVPLIATIVNTKEFKTTTYLPAKKLTKIKQ